MKITNIYVIFVSWGFREWEHFPYVVNNRDWDPGDGITISGIYVNLIYNLEIVLSPKYVPIATCTPAL